MSFNWCKTSSTTKFICSNEAKYQHHKLFPSFQMIRLIKVCELLLQLMLHKLNHISSLFNIISIYSRTRVQVCLDMCMQAMKLSWDEFLCIRILFSKTSCSHSKINCSWRKYLTSPINVIVSSPKKTLAKQKQKHCRAQNTFLTSSTSAAPQVQISQFDSRASGCRVKHTLLPFLTCVTSMRILGWTFFSREQSRNC